MSGIRVIGGSAKGRKLLMVPGQGTRPIGDRVKESLFNILGAHVVESSVLDLFAGTGSVGIEALSRGARSAVFIDIDRRAVDVIRRNLKLTNLGKFATVLQADAFRYLRRDLPERFDLIYLAPPQYHGLWSRALRALDAAPRWLNPDAFVVAQIDPKEFEKVDLERLSLADQRRYGNTLLLFYEYPGQ